MSHTISAYPSSILYSYAHPILLKSVIHSFLILSNLVTTLHIRFYFCYFHLYFISFIECATLWCIHHRWLRNSFYQNFQNSRMNPLFENRSELRNLCFNFLKLFPKCLFKLLYYCMLLNVIRRYLFTISNIFSFKLRHNCGHIGHDRCFNHEQDKSVSLITSWFYTIVLYIYYSINFHQRKKFFPLVKKKKMDFSGCCCKPFDCTAIWYLLCYRYIDIIIVDR